MTQPQTNAQDILLDVQHINVDYLAENGVVHAVRDVSFTLRRGQIMGLAGESGSGKSTLAFAIARLLRPPALITGGSAFYYPRPDRRAALPALAHPQRTTASPSVDILHLTPPQLRAFRWNELAVVFQSAMNALNPVMTIGTQLIDVLKAHQRGRGEEAYRKRARELLEIVGIAPDRLRSYPHELSGGMRQRVAIAIALALQPELIIMDEPTTALDVVMQREILELISSLCVELNTSLIFITHDLSLLLELADEVAIMYAGQLIEHASRTALYQHPRHPYTYGLMNSFPSISGPRRVMRGIIGNPPDLRHIPRGCPFHERCPFVFAPCTEIVPALQPAVASTPQQAVACHLYNPRQTGVSTIPDTSVLAQGYERHGKATTSPTLTNTTSPTQLLGKEAAHQ